jgi:hypothetical protein
MNISRFSSVGSRAEAGEQEADGSQMLAAGLGPQGGGQRFVDVFALDILWATRAVHDALHDDDRLLTDAIDRLRQSPPPYGSADVLADGLTATSEGWLGSYACASFIGSQLDRVAGPPLFWTWEQGGEEAAGWLLFEHKLEYLRDLRNRFADPNTRMVRVFCLPEPGLGPVAERVLLLLACALMEAMGVAVQVCDGPAYATVEGFVLTPNGGVIVANWCATDVARAASLTTGRTIGVTFDHGEDFFTALEEICRTEVSAPTPSLCSWPASAMSDIVGTCERLADPNAQQPHTQAISSRPACCS